MALHTGFQISLLFCIIFLRYIQVYAWIDSSFFLVLGGIPLYKYTIICFSIFLLIITWAKYILGLTLSKAAINTCVQICSFSSCKHLGVEPLGQTVNVHWVLLYKLPDLYPSSSYTSTDNIWEFCLFHTLTDWGC